MAFKLFYMFQFMKQPFSVLQKLLPLCIVQVNSSANNDCNLTAV